MPATPATTPNMERTSSSLTDNGKQTPENRLKPVQPAASGPDRCTHLRADGKRCADALYPGHATLCHHHLSQQMRGIPDGNSIAADILSSVGNFQSASAINIVLGKLIIHQLTGRIARREAVALAYTCQLLLQTLPHVKQELKETGFSSYWREETKRILGDASDLDQITDPELLPGSALQLHPQDHIDQATSTEPASPAPSSAHPSAPSLSSSAQSANASSPANPSLPAITSSAQCRAGRAHDVCGSSVRSTEDSPAAPSMASSLVTNSSSPASTGSGGLQPGSSTPKTRG